MLFPFFSLKTDKTKSLLDTFQDLIKYTSSYTSSVFSCGVIDSLHCCPLHYVYVSIYHILRLSACLQVFIAH